MTKTDADSETFYVLLTNRRRNVSMDTHQFNGTPPLKNCRKLEVRLLNIFNVRSNKFIYLVLVILMRTRLKTVSLANMKIKFECDIYIDYPFLSRKLPINYNHCYIRITILYTHVKLDL
jgi:hypothetical protein